MFKYFFFFKIIIGIFEKHYQCEHEPKKIKTIPETGTNLKHLMSNRTTKVISINLTQIAVRIMFWLLRIKYPDARH